MFEHDIYLKRLKLGWRLNTRIAVHLSFPVHFEDQRDIRVLTGSYNMRGTSVMSKRRCWPPSSSQKVRTSCCLRSSTTGTSLCKHTMLVSITHSQLWSPSTLPASPNLPSFTLNSGSPEEDAKAALKTTHTLLYTQCYSYTVEVTLQQCGRNYVRTNMLLQAQHCLCSHAVIWSCVSVTPHR